MDVEAPAVPKEMPPSSWINDDHINRWRYRPGTNKTEIEIELTRDKIAICDFNRFDDVQRHKWFAKYAKAKRTDGLWYAATNVTDASNGKRTLLFQNIVKPLDHINHDGLDNRPLNVRSGSHSINARNKQNVVGVHDNGTAYVAQWYEFDGKRKGKHFLKSKFESDEDAFAAALACRTENATRVINEKLASQAAAPIALPIAREVIAGKLRKPKVHIPVKGLSYASLRGHEYVKGEISINGITYKRGFALSMYDYSLDKAIAAGTEWTNSIRADHPQQPRTKKAKIDDE